MIASSVCSRSSSTAPRTKACRSCSGRGHRRDREVAARVGVREYLDGLAEEVWWHRGAVSPTATASPTGRCRDAQDAGARRRGRAREERARRAGRDAAARLSRRGRASMAGASTSLICWRSADRVVARQGSLFGVAALLRAAFRRWAGGARIRGPAVGGREPAGLRRTSPRLVALPSDLRARLDATRDPERRPGWGGAGRSSTTLSLDPLSDRAMAS